MTTEIVIVRQQAEFSQGDMDTFRRVLYALADGLNDQHKKRFRRFWNWLWRAEPGEMVTWLQRRERSSPFHRRHFAIEQRLFDAQERFDEFDSLRTYLKVAAGFVQWVPGGPGMPAVVPIPKSMSYTALDDDGMRELHDAMVRSLRSTTVLKCLWPHLKPLAAQEIVEQILLEFDER